VTVIRRGILIIEDNMTDGLVIKRTLSKHLTDDITIVRDGMQAINALSEKLKSRPSKEDVVIPRLITLDLNMPKMNGFELLDRLREHEDTKSIPIIVLTSSQIPDEITRAYQMGVNNYVVKPTDHEKFEQTIEKIYRYWFEFSRIPED